MKSFSELTSASYVSNSDILAISQENSGTYSSKKTTVKEVSDFANQNFAEEYDSTSSYAVGDYVIYESVLYKCTASTTGSFDNTKWTSVVVTNEMGSGGGGGTGGHTIIDENGNSMTARAGLQFVGANVDDDATNNKTIVDLASAGGIDGVFIDTDNVIKSTTIFTNSMTYTATEDCVIAFYIVGKANTDGLIKIDNKKVGGFYAGGTVGFSCFYNLKDGQTITVTNAHASYSSDYTVYGIQTGTTHSKFQPVIYSTEEREIGVWKDGKPLYEKTFYYEGNITTNSTTEIADLSSLSPDTILPLKTTIDEAGWAVLDLPCEGFRLQISYTSKKVSLINSSTLSFNPARVNFVVQYTKTTDVAGSGSWTPQGVPAHHYSTDEQIVGTWNGKTLYEKTVYNTSSLNYGQRNNISTGILDADEILLATGSVSYGSNGSYLPLPYAEAGTNEIIKVGEFNKTNGNIQIFVGNAYQSPYLVNKVILTIRYTKSS